MESITINVDELEETIQRAFEKSGASTRNARSVARALTLAEVDGKTGHGLLRVPSYIGQLRAGKVDGKARPRATQLRPGVLVVDANGGFAYPAFDLVHRQLPALTNQTGIAAAAIRRSHHFGVAGHQAERLADAGLVGLVFGNSPKAMAPWGGRDAVFGTNPVAFAAPRRAAPPIVVDLALSQVARANVLKAAEAGEAIPQGWALDREGRPTTDAKAALAGTMTPLGGAKGAALALMVEVLAAVLVGANLSFEASSFFDEEGPPPAVGQLLIAIDPRAFADGQGFFARMERLVEVIESQEGARLPGSQRIARRERAKAKGVEVDTAILAKVRAFATA